MFSFTIEEFEEMFDYKIPEKDKKNIRTLENTLLTMACLLAVTSLFGY